MLLYLLSFLSIIIQVCFLGLGMICAVYYLAELVEEYTVATKRLITYIILVSVLVYALLLFLEPGVPLMLCVGGIAAHALHALILTTFPYVRLTSVSFLGACAMLVFNHWQALQFFQQHWHPVSQVLAYFTTCVWPVPLLLLVSLCANDNVLPTVNERSPLLNNDDVVTSYFSTRGKKLGILSLFSYAKESILPERVKKAY